MYLKMYVLCVIYCHILKAISICVSYKVRDKPLQPNSVVDRCVLKEHEW